MDTPKLSLIQKIKLFFTAKDVITQFTKGPKSSFLTGEFWAKVAAGVCVMWAGVHGFCPEPLATYITVGLALWVSLERLYLKKKHMESVADLSKAPAFDPNQLTILVGKLIEKYPKLAPVEPIADALVKDVDDALKDVSTIAPAS